MAVDAYVHRCLQLFVDMWVAQKQLEAPVRLYDDQIKKLWRIVDHYEWWMIVDVFENRGDDARTINYMLAILDDETNYDRFAYDPRSYQPVIPSGKKQNSIGEGNVQTETEGFVTRRGETVRLGDAIQSLRDQTRVGVSAGPL